MASVIVIIKKNRIVQSTCCTALSLSFDTKKIFIALKEALQVHLKEGRLGDEKLKRPCPRDFGAR